MHGGQQSVHPAHEKPRGRTGGRVGDCRPGEAPDLFMLDLVLLLVEIGSAKKVVDGLVVLELEGQQKVSSGRGRVSSRSPRTGPRAGRSIPAP